METITAPKIIYPETDGKPMAENTKQFDYIVLIKEGLEATFAENPDVFIAGDLFWYPVEGNPRIVYAPDIMVAIGRPKGFRKSYRQWEEADIAPQVVFEVLSPGNRLSEMMKKFIFYQQYGVQEYYVYDPDENTLEGWLRKNDVFEEISNMEGWESPRLQVKFSLENYMLVIYRKDGTRFRTYTELSQEVEALEQLKNQLSQEKNQLSQEKNQLSQEKNQLSQEKNQLSQEKNQLSQENQLLNVENQQLNIEKEEAKNKARQLAEKLRELGIDPDTIA
jgi:Uma2 family endonuclease